MDFLRVMIETTHEAADLLADELAGLTGGCQVDDPATLEELKNSPSPRWDYLEEQALGDPSRTPAVSFYLTPDEEGQDLLRQIGALLAEKHGDAFYGTLKISVLPVQSEDWENNWKQYYKPFMVGRRLLVCPSWEKAEVPDGRTLLTMDPLSSFGTGSHATTRLCMEQMDMLDLAGANILDVGCGSGILACTALLLGGTHAIACDIEENAMLATQENMGKNGQAKDKYETRRGDLLTEGTLRDELTQKGPYRLILANIVADVLIAMAPYLPAWLAPGGYLILSGIISERESEVRAAYADMIEVRSDRRDGWSMLCLKVN